MCERGKKRKAQQAAAIPGAESLSNRQSITAGFEVEFIHTAAQQATALWLLVALSASCRQTTTLKSKPGAATFSKRFSQTTAR